MTDSSDGGTGGGGAGWDSTPAAPDAWSGAADPGIGGTWAPGPGGPSQVRRKFDRSFFRGPWKWVTIAGLVVLLVTAGFMIYPVVNAATPAESHEQDARKACRAEALAQLDTPGSARLSGVTAKEYGENNWTISGTVEIDGTSNTEFSCLYAGSKIVNLNVG